MTSDQISLVQITFETIKPIRNRAIKLFFSRLIESHPSLLAVIGDDYEARARSLRPAVEMIIGCLGNMEALKPILRSMARSNAELGMQEHHYLTAVNTILWTMERCLGSAYSAEVDAAWEDVCWQICEVMNGSKCLAAA
jgi:hemoglobin-like flavoprotein